MTLREAETNCIQWALSRTDRLKQAANLLGITERTLREKRKRLNLPLRSTGPRASRDRAPDTASTAAGPSSSLARKSNTAQPSVYATGISAHASKATP